MIRYGRGIRNIGGKVTRAAEKHVQNVALSGTTTPIAASSKRRSAIRGGIHPGNMAGFKNEKSVRLEHNLTGYNNPANQTARFSPREPIISKAPKIQAASMLPRNKQGCFMNLRHPCSGSSAVLKKKLS